MAMRNSKSGKDGSKLRNKSIVDERGGADEGTEAETMVGLREAQDSG